MQLAFRVCHRIINPLPPILDPLILNNIPQWEYLILEALGGRVYIRGKGLTSSLNGPRLLSRSVAAARMLKPAVEGGSIGVRSPSKA